jgi:tyrosyl-DNA phosphodiesterase-1
MSKRSYGRRDNPINLVQDEDYDDDNDSVEFKFRQAEERDRAAQQHLLTKTQSHQDVGHPDNILLSSNPTKRPRVVDDHQNQTTSTTVNINFHLRQFSTPIKLFATLQDEEIRGRHCKSSSTAAAAAAKTSDGSDDDDEYEDDFDKNCHRLEFCWTLREMLGLDVHPQHDSLHVVAAHPTTTSPSVDWIVIANYIIDFDFLLQEIPELVSFPRVVIIYGHADNDPPSAWANLTAVDLIMRRPADPPQSRYNPLPFRIPFGVHHSKLFLIGFSTGILRVVIHTANLRYNDIHLKTQGAFLQDFPLKSSTVNRATSLSNEFEETLVSYMATYSYTKSRVWDDRSSNHESCNLTQLLRRYDFATAQAILIPSTPGYHPLSADGTCHVGHLKLRHALATMVYDNKKYDVQLTTKRDDSHLTTKKLLPNQRKQQKPEGSGIICQFSSIGSLTEAWLRELELSMDIAATAPTGKPPTISSSSSCSTRLSRPIQLRLVYPTVEEIRNSVEGYRGGGSVPGSNQNVSKAFLRPLYHKWSTSGTQDMFQRSQHVPHIKSYYQLTPDGKAMEWFVLTSHNLSKAAWGEVIQSSQHGKAKRLFIRHWELGVLIKGIAHVISASETKTTMQHLRSMLKPVSTEGHKQGSTIIPLPYQLWPEPYQPSDRPWAVDRAYTIPDSRGQLWT